VPDLSNSEAHSWHRLDGVDLLRGLAILFVLMNHVNMRLVIAHIPYGEALPHQLLRTLVWNGQRGVQIFFAVSGFLITSTTLRRWGTLSQIRVRDFYLLRFARIAPLLLLLLTILSALHFARVPQFVVAARTGGLGRALLAALTFHVNWLEASRGYLPGSWDILWSLSVEEAFYLFFPLVCRLFGRSKRFGRGELLFGILAAFIILGPLARTIFAHDNEVWREVSYLGGMDAIAFGCLTAILLPKLQLPRGGLLGIQITGIAVMFSVLTLPLHSLARTGLDMTILALGTCMVIAAVAQTRRKGWWIMRPFLWLGRRSYEVYLTHMFVVFALFSLFLRLRTQFRSVPALFVSVVILAALLGEAVARFYSEPMNRFLRERWNEGTKNLGSVINASS
jgi:peptidoglycan/LPS O-acetylase OafA/YrhL